MRDGLRKENSIRVHSDDDDEDEERCRLRRWLLSHRKEEAKEDRLVSKLYVMT
jgi:hypothetical protein